MVRLRHRRGGALVGLAVLALCVLLGVPVIAVIVGPLLRRLERAETVYRQEQGDLTTRAGDIVAGLRVLAGVGGRDLFGRRYAARSQELRAEGYRVGAVFSWIDALTVVIPGVFLAAVVWLAARMAAPGDITIGELVAVYGYVAVLIVPVWFLLEGGHELIRGRVAARRIIALLTLAPDEVGGPGHRRPGAVPRGTARPGTPPAGDRRPGRAVRPGHRPDGRAGELVGVAADDPADAVALADRLGRYVASDVTWGGVPLTRDRARRGAGPDPGGRPRLLPVRRTLRDILRAGADDRRRAGSARRCGPRRPRTSSTRSPTASTRRSTPGPAPSPAGSGNGYGWPGRCSPNRRC